MLPSPPPRVFYICGGIGAGKSTALRHLRDCGLACVPEPVAEWQRCGMLAAAYQTQARGPGDPWNPAVHLDPAAFQTTALATRFAALQTALAAGGAPALVVERSLDEDRAVFAAETIPPGSPAMAAYDLAWAQLTAAVGPHTAYYVYLDCPVDIMLARVAHRGRPEESGLTEQYLSRLAARYDQWAAGLPQDRTLRIDASRGAEHVAAEVAAWVFSVNA